MTTTRKALKQRMMADSFLTSKGVLLPRNTSQDAAMSEKLIALSALPSSTTHQELLEFHAEWSRKMHSDGTLVDWRR